MCTLQWDGVKSMVSLWLPALRDKSPVRNGPSSHLSCCDRLEIVLAHNKAKFPLTRCMTFVTGVQPAAYTDIIPFPYPPSDWIIIPSTQIVSWGSKEIMCIVVLYRSWRDRLLFIKNLHIKFFIYEASDMIEDLWSIYLNLRYYN